MPFSKQASWRVRNPRKTSIKEKLAKARAAKAALKLKASEPDATPCLDPPSTPVSSSIPPDPPSTPVSSSIPPDPPLTVSASKRKLGYLTSPEMIEGDTPEFPCAPSHLELLQALFDGVTCKSCLQGSVTLSTDSSKTKGLSIGLISTCDTCGVVCGRTNTSRKSSGQSYEINRAVVAASLNVGIGHASLSKFCQMLGMPSLHQKTYRLYVNQIHHQAEATTLSITEKARDIVRNMYEADSDGIIDIPVTFDGTWHKRGHTSNHGAAAVICAVTGLVLDWHVMSLYCQICKITGARKTDPAEYAVWWESHKDKCSINFSGSSGGMEAAAAKVLWGRSLNYKIRYTTLIGDGDSKTFTAVTKLDPYNGVPVAKAECVNHVAKRLGTALRNLVADQKKRGVTLGGRGKGTLTQEKMGKLQSYYTKAVRSHNSSVETMSRAIWASFYHCTSSDDKPQHQFCPEGEASWCFYNRSLSRGEPTPPHTDRLTTSLNSTVAPHIEQVYQRLTDPALLEKCLSGVTQNQNESFHSQLWLRCPKHIFVTRPRIELATCLAICEWNQGSLGINKFMEKLGLLVSKETILHGRKRDACRIRKAEGAILEAAKRRRLQRKTAAQREAGRRQAEDPDAYEPGAGSYS